MDCSGNNLSELPKKLFVKGIQFYAIYFLSFCMLWAVSADVALAGFGCPFSGYECHHHCQSIGRKGGYCAGFLNFTCTCYRTKKVKQIYHSPLSFAIGVVNIIWSQNVYYFFFQ